MQALILTLSFYPCFPWCTARTDILWPTPLRSRGCSTRRWRKTLSSAALSVNRGEDRGFLCGAGWSRALRGSFVVPGTRLWLTPAHCSLTSTFCPSGTKQRSESGYALMFPVRLTRFFWMLNFLCCGVVMQGINLSGGQRQRICVARALYQNTNIVFLVSATVSVIKLKTPSVMMTVQILSILLHRFFTGRVTASVSVRLVSGLGARWPLGRGGVRFLIPFVMCLSC